jgi:hypothetical protein
MNIIEALESRQHFGGLSDFRDLGSWRNWIAFLKAVYGLPLDAGEIEVFRKHTGRQAPRPDGYPEAVQIVGVQSGKTKIAVTVVDYEALRAEPGTHAVLLAQDHRGSLRTALRYAREPFKKLEAFKRAVENETADTVMLDNDVSISAYPSRPEAVRGLRACVVCIDELAHFRTSEGHPNDIEMLRVARGRLATTGGKLLVLSSPYGQSAALWDLYRRHYAREDSETLIWQASAPEMNPKLSKNYLARMEEEDPEAYRSEVLGEFRAGLSMLFGLDELDAVVDRGRRETMPEEDVRYAAHFDPSGGKVDAAALAIGHRVGQMIVVDLVRHRPSPHNPEQGIQQAADILKAYRLDRVQIDHYGGSFPSQVFERAGIRAVVASRVTSDNQLALVPLVNSKHVLLPDHPDLLRELRGLERRTGSGGKDSVNHRRAAHDDMAAAVAGLCAALPEKAALVIPAPGYLGGRGDEDDENDHAAVNDPGGYLGDASRRGRGRGWPSGW